MIRACLTLAALFLMVLAGPAASARYAIYPRGSLAYPAEAPAPRARVLTPGWSAQRGRHPQGSPAGMAVARDGSIWIADDRSAASLRIALA